MAAEIKYTEDNIKTLAWNEHIRKRAGMYIGRLGNGDNPGDGIYVLLKETIDNSIDEFSMGFGKVIDITIEDKTVTVRDFGRGIPLGKVVEVTSTLNTGGKFDDAAFQKSVGLNGVGSKAVNALSEDYYVESFRDGMSSFAHYSRGELIESGQRPTKEKNGTYVKYTADREMFSENFTYNMEYVEPLIKNYAYLKKGLTLNLNGTSYRSEHGLLDLINDSMSEEPLYPPVHLEGEDIEIVNSPVGMPGRAIHNAFLDKVKEQRPKIEKCLRCIHTCDVKTTPYCITRALINAVKGNMENALLFCGSNAYRIQNIVPVHQLMQELMQETNLAMQA